MEAQVRGAQKITLESQSMGLMRLEIFFLEKGKHYLVDFWRITEISQILGEGYTRTIHEGSKRRVVNSWRQIVRSSLLGIPRYIIWIHNILRDYILERDYPSPCYRLQYMTKQSRSTLKLIPFPPLITPNIPRVYNQIIYY